MKKINEEEVQDLRVQTPSHYESTDDEESDEETQDAHRQYSRDTSNKKDTHGDNTAATPKVKSSFFCITSFILNMLNLILVGWGASGAPKEKTSKSTEKSKEGSKSHHTSTGKSAQEEPIHADKDLEEPAHQEFDTGFTEDQSVDETTQHPDYTLARNKDPRKSFKELMDTPLDFSAFVMNRLKVDTLTPELLVGPTYELMKCSYKSLVELEYFLEEVCKATTNQLDWNNPEGQQYPHDLRKPLPLIPNSQGNYNRLRLQDIEDMLLLLVHGKLINLNVEECLALGVSLRMFTRSVVLKRRVEDLQLGVESYQKKLNLISDPDGSTLPSIVLEKCRHGKIRSYDPSYLSTTQEQKVIEEPRKIHWWEIVRGRPSAAEKDHMIYHMMSLSKTGQT
ncbi:hypothetical protein Tco_0264895 [Tanacetum coccineum]